MRKKIKIHKVLEEDLAFYLIDSQLVGIKEYTKLPEGLPKDCIGRLHGEWIVPIKKESPKGEGN